MHEALIGPGIPIEKLRLTGCGKLGQQCLTSVSLAATCKVSCPWRSATLVMQHTTNLRFCIGAGVVAKHTRKSSASALPIKNCIVKLRL
eukprot:3792455-Amphidinium_carterae.1